MVDVYHRSDIRPHIWLYFNLTLFSFQGTRLRFSAPAALCDAYICYHFLTHRVNIYFLTFLVLSSASQRRLIYLNTDQECVSRRFLFSCAFGLTERRLAYLTTAVCILSNSTESVSILLWFVHFCQ